MVPAGDPTSAVVTALSETLAAGDTVIDGGNSYYRDDIARAASLAEKDIHYLDVGTSGGVWGRERGYCLMIGGDAPTVQRLAPAVRRDRPRRGRRPAHPRTRC